MVNFENQVCKFIFEHMKFFLAGILVTVAVYVWGQNTPFKIATTHLVDNIYVHTSYGLPDGKNVFPSNGLFIITDTGIVLIDTPWGEDQTEQLINILQKKFKKKILLCISTHFHADRTGGIDVLKKYGIKTYCSALTKQLAKQNGDKQPQFTFRIDTTFHVGNTTLQTYYPGEGHTKDNIVIWLPQSKVLFGGCLIKSLEADGAGNTADANMTQWPVSVTRLKKRFDDIKYVIPGHQGWKGDTLMFSHTIAVVKQKA